MTRALLLAAVLALGCGYTADQCQSACAPRLVSSCERERVSCVEADHVVDAQRLIVLYCWEVCRGSPQTMVRGQGKDAHCECDGIPSGTHKSVITPYEGVIR